VLLFVAGCHGPVVLDFVTGTVSLQVAHNFSGPSYLSKDRGKRPVDDQLENMADQKYATEKETAASSIMYVSQ
jgi:hypothetical protein